MNRWDITSTYFNMLQQNPSLCPNLDFIGDGTTNTNSTSRVSLSFFLACRWIMLKYVEYMGCSWQQRASFEKGILHKFFINPHIFIPFYSISFQFIPFYSNPHLCHSILQILGTQIWEIPDFIGDGATNAYSTSRVSKGFGRWVSELFNMFGVSRFYFDFIEMKWEESMGIDGIWWGLMGCNRDSLEIFLILWIYVGYCGILWNHVESIGIKYVD